MDIHDFFKVNETKVQIVQADQFRDKIEFVRTSNHANLTSIISHDFKVQFSTCAQLNFEIWIATKNFYYWAINILILSGDSNLGSKPLSLLEFETWRVSKVKLQSWKKLISKPF